MAKKTHFEIKPAKDLHLQKIPTLVTAEYTSDHDYKSLLREGHAQLEDLQNLLYAERTRAVLIVFQGMDGAGKDGAIKHVMGGINPQGCVVTSFKEPSAEELDHDFFWRINRALPARGMIGIFNRSYYEETLITRVHPELLTAEKLPAGKFGKKFWEHRYQDIINHEKYLQRQGYVIIKIFLHISKDEQKRRLLDRFTNPEKHWKIAVSDIRERSFWKQYQRAYGECLARTTSKHAPWHLVPADDKQNARLMISEIIIGRLRELKLHYPSLSAQQKTKLKKMRSLLTKN